MKKIYRLPPCSIYDVPAMETWLMDMARTGLYLKKAGRRYMTFTKGEPSDASYRLEPVMDSSQTPACEVQDDYTRAGWKFVTVIQKSFFVWQSMRPDYDELHSDPVVHSTAYEHLLKSLAKNAVSAAILPVAVFAVFAGGMLLSPQPVTLFLASAAMPLAIAAEFIFGIQAVRQFLRLHSFKRSLADGLPAKHRKNYRKGLWLRRTIRAATDMLTLVILTAVVCVFGLHWEKTVSDIDTAMPYLPLDVIEEGRDFSWHKEPYIRRGVDAYNRAEYTWSLFVPVHYDIYQQGQMQHVYQDPDTAAVAPSASTEYFQLALPCFTLPLYREKIRCCIHSDTDAVVTELSHPDLDQVTIAKSEGYTQLFACRGRQVIHIRYWGDADLAAKLDMLADALQHI